ncbi:hypothetical protein P168DRAFT_291200 [Aspergillus campestris IBT 28561]|uniref:Uncharacterized protein n=1 Tax=Aspergillus campestris (strain IBT 28561) TaxID=1392248 RepID=A0A2I1CZJ0_ASPC2|nr:uncharacterized protein P168DRAFT_291200 [Aspergillus campestris IBT 28561]PKY03043.1 hypothetical protein P168DRAFT_291200 [Aspergillus campestris IBT 28561]
MADVRSLLRNELASRKGGSPSQSGKQANRVTKKRKVDSGEDLTRKKIRQAVAHADLQPASIVQPPSAQALEDAAEAEEVDEQEIAGPELPTDEQEEMETSAEVSTVPPTTAPSSQPTTTTQDQRTIDEDEWAAFEREVAAPSRLAHAPAALTAEATISAAPMTAEQLAAQQERDAQAAKSRSREAEAEGEREDAARFMEDEFDEMEQLEERVRRLKHMREELRKKTGEEETLAPGEPTATAMAGKQDNSANESKEEEDDDDDDQDDDDDDDWDNWRFR